MNSAQNWNRPSGPQVDEDMAFQRRTWIVQRCCWLLMSGVIVAALLGLFGGNGLTYAVAPSGAFTLAYAPYVRRAAPNELRFTIAATSQSRVRVIIDRAYVEAIKFDQILPWPESIGRSGENWVFSFPSPEGEPLAMIFYIKPQRAGRLEAKIGVEGGGTLAVSQFVYP